MMIGDRIKQRLDALGMSGAELARRVGLKQPTISALISGKSRSSAHLHLIARELQTSVEYLTGETDDPGPTKILKDRQIGFRGPPAEEIAPASDLVKLHEFDVSFGLGATFIHDVPVTGKLRVFSREWVRQFTSSPMEYLFFATGIGDSMVPTILDSDVVLIDSFDRTPRFADKLWALEVGGMGSIKRLRPTKDGTGMVLISSNPEVPDDVAYDGEMQIIGRVAGIFRKT